MEYKRLTGVVVNVLPVDVTFYEWIVDLVLDRFPLSAQFSHHMFQTKQYTQTQLKHVLS